MSAASWRFLFKKTDQVAPVPFLLREELQAVPTPDPATRDGVRDRAMLHLAVAGARPN